MGLYRAVMIGDDVETDVGGAMAAGLPGILVRTGKYRQDAVTARVTPTAIVDSIKDAPGTFTRIVPRLRSQPAASQRGWGTPGGMGLTSHS